VGATIATQGWLLFIAGLLAAVMVAIALVLLLAYAAVMIAAAVVQGARSFAYVRTRVVSCAHASSLRRFGLLNQQVNKRTPLTASITQCI
jgi:hypothetical protein